MKLVKIKCDDIKIGKRIRDNINEDNLKSLIGNIKEFGLLSPIGVTKDNELIYGERRLTACKKLGYDKIDCIVIKASDMFKLECSENIERAEFTMSQRAELRKGYTKIFEQERTSFVEKGLKVPKKYKGNTKDIVAKFSRVSRTTANKEDDILAFDDKEIIEQVDKNELSVNGAYNLVKEKEKESKATSENVNDETDTLPVEEPVEESIDPPIEPTQIEDDIYSITLSDNYDDLTLSPSLSDEIQRYSKGIETLPLTYIRNALVQAFGKE